MKPFFALLSLILLSPISFAGFEQTPQTLENTELNIHPLGNPEHPTLILLGGGPGFTSWNLQPIQKSLVDLNWQVFLWDMRGLGENKHLPAANSIASWINDIEAVRKHSQKEKVTLLGHSWGALMAMLYAREYPNHVNRIILLNPVDPEKSSMQALTEAIHQRNLKELNQRWDDDSAWENTIETQPDA